MGEAGRAAQGHARLVVHHQNMTYLIHWLGMQEVGCAGAKARACRRRRRT